MRVVIIPPLDKELFGGKDRFELEAGNLFGIIAQLGALSPGFASIADARVGLAIDGVVTADWSASLANAQEIIVLPRVGGG